MVFLQGNPSNWLVSAWSPFEERVSAEMGSVQKMVGFSLVALEKQPKGFTTLRYHMGGLSNIKNVLD